MATTYRIKRFSDNRYHHRKLFGLGETVQNTAGGIVEGTGRGIKGASGIGGIAGGIAGASVGAGAATAGGLVGAGTGATLGTMILPGIGTAAGAAIGGGLGALVPIGVGYKLGDTIGSEATKAIGSAVESAGEGIKS